MDIARGQILEGNGGIGNRKTVNCVACLTVSIGCDDGQHRKDGELTNHEDENSYPVHDQRIYDSSAPAMLNQHTRHRIDQPSFHSLTLLTSQRWPTVFAAQLLGSDVHQ